MLPDYYEHMSENKNTLLCRFFGVFRIQPNKQYFLVMNNVLDTMREIQTVSCVDACQICVFCTMQITCVCVCVCVCVRACTCVCVCVCLVCVYLHGINTCTFLHGTCLCTFIQTVVHFTYAYVHMHMRILQHMAWC